MNFMPPLLALAFFFEKNSLLLASLELNDERNFGVPESIEDSNKIYKETESRNESIIEVSNNLRDSRGSEFALTSIPSKLEKNEKYRLLQSNNFKMDLEKSTKEILNSLVKVTASDRNIVPLARSYNGRKWEKISTEANVLSIDCDDEKCTIELPHVEEGEKYEVNTYSRSLSDVNVLARFLEQATFGATQEELKGFNSGSAVEEYIAQWIEDEMKEKSMTLHRAWFRERVVHPSPKPNYCNRPLRPCEANTRYRKFAFFSKDKNSNLVITQQGPELKLTVNGQLRTMANSIDWLKPEYVTDNGSMNVNGGEYYFCKEPEDFIGGRVWITDPNTHSCQLIKVNDEEFGNIQVNLNVNMILSSELFTISGSEAEAMNNDFYENYLPQEIFLTKPLVHSNCDKYVEDVDVTDAYALYDNEFYIHSPPPLLITNTLESPNSGGVNEALTHGKTYCSNAPRTFLNEDTCKMATDDNACGWSHIEGKGVIECGSPGEIANDPTTQGLLGNGKFDFSLKQWVTTGDPTFAMSRKTVWLNLVINAQDQLRQRFAWILNQILVVAYPSISSQLHSEPWLIYYDIFVRNAFGNYRDILREISYSPHMAENLSYLDSQSTAYIKENYRIFSYPDENFAREIMQLFTIGLCELNADGTTVYGENGECIKTYSNEEIMSYSRAWTGFTFNRYRGNIESRTTLNHNDPMDINKDARDMFPKLGLHGFYIGDRKPLCLDRPDNHFMKKGAKYRLLGASSFPELQYDPELWTNDEEVVRFKLDINSKLFDALCGQVNGACQFKSVIILEEDLPDEDFNVDNLRVVQVTDGIFYEYLPLPCVEQGFQNGAVKLVKQFNGNVICGDPRRSIASTACCETDSNDAGRNETYWGERVKFNTAKNRCENSNKIVCETPKIKDCFLGSSMLNECVHDIYYWTSAPCRVMVKIDSTNGKVAIVHSADEKSQMASRVEVDTPTYFRVQWLHDNGFPTPEDDCGSSSSCEIIENECICEVSVEENLVFNALPSKYEVLSKLKIGAFHPFSLNYVVSTSENGVTVYHKQDFGEYTEETIFEVQDDVGVIYYLKNVASVVKLLNTSPTFSFRNPPHFMSLVDSEKLNAIYETEETIDHYFYHSNTAPFLAKKFIQRFGISNPSPNYISNVAKAFSLGQFTWISDQSSKTLAFGTGTYGDLAATVSAILLDSEARSFILDEDPGFGSVREPLLKLVHILRSLNVESFSRTPLIEWRLNAMSLLTGQEPYVMESVFSYFMPDFEPSGSMSVAHLVSPESQLLTDPNMIGLVNGLFSLLKYGVTADWGGFFHRFCAKHYLVPGDHECSLGFLNFSPSVTSVPEVIDELSTLLTSGRLSEENTKIVEEIYSNATDEREGLIMVQQAIATSAEFHTTGRAKPANLLRPMYVPNVATGEPYKAIVLVFLEGGADTFNMLVPRCDPLLSAYLDIRQTLALTEAESLPITTPSETGQFCNDFGIHHKLPKLHQQYNDGNVIFFANSGIISEEMDSTNFEEKEKSVLFAHNRMTDSFQRVDPHFEAAGTGILGRISSALAHKYNVGSFSLDGFTVALESLPGLPPDPVILNAYGPTQFDPNPHGDLRISVDKMNQKSTLKSNLFSDFWSEQFSKAIAENDFLIETLKDATISQGFRGNNNKLMQQLLQVAKLIDTREARGVDKDVFFTAMEGFDHHAYLKKGTNQLFPMLDDALGEFWNEMGSQNMQEDVVVLVVSEFGRTMTPNSKSGSDHGWGGNYFLLSNSAKGGRILGSYPDEFDGVIDAGRNRLIPTTPIDSVWNGIAQWIGIKDEKYLDLILPNRQRFKSKLFTASDLFI